MKVSLTKTMNACRLFGFCWVLIFTIFTTAQAAPRRVAIVPFKINAAEDLAYLREGILDMLTSRLAWEDNVQVIGRQETLQKAGQNQTLTESAARELGMRLSADFVLYGSLTVFGNSVSIDAKVVDVTGDRPALTFYNQSNGMDEVIRSIDGFADDINQKLFGRRSAVAAPPPESTRSTAATPQPAQRQSGFQTPSPAQTDIHAHPEKLLETGPQPGAGVFYPAQTSGPPTPNPAFSGNYQRTGDSSGFWRSRTFAQLLNGLAIGDLDQDGQNETVVLTDKSVMIFRMAGGRMEKLFETEPEELKTYAGVDIGDINGNGYPEIFVSVLTQDDQRVDAFVLEYNGREYVRILSDSHYCFRVVHLPGQGEVLLGQKFIPGKSPFAQPVVQLVWQNADLEVAKDLIGPKKANVLGVAYGDAMDDGQAHALVYNPQDFLQILDSSGDEIWKSGDPYGGGALSFVLKEQMKNDPVELEHLPMRLLIRDIDGDGKAEVLAIRNKEITGRLFTRFRSYVKTEIIFLAWDGIGLAEKWKTREFSGHIRDFNLGDFDNDGRLELIAALVTKTGSLIGTDPKSLIMAYDLN